MQTQSDTLLDKLGRFWMSVQKAWGWGLGAVFVISSLYGAYYWLTPHVEITPGTIGSDTDATKAEFLIKNTGHLNLENVDFHCEIQNRFGTYKAGTNLIVTPERSPMLQFISLLPPGPPATRNCGQGALEEVAFPATFRISLTYKWLDRFNGSHNATFTSIRDATGHIQISPDVN